MTEIIMGRLITKSNTYITLLIFIGITVYFLNSLGSSTCVFSAELLIFLFAKQIKNKYEYTVVCIGFMTIYIGTYFLTILFLPKSLLIRIFEVKGFYKFFHLLNTLLITIYYTIAFHKIQNAIILSEIRLKKAVTSLISLVGNLKVNYYYKLAKKGIHHKLTKEEIKVASLVFEKKIHSPLKTIVSNGK
ncbi:hypothetical protein TMP248_80119 [Tenacibaculum maritimum]|uniref:hypothetical protein n=1 Tax=Tenacibaculum maritimum TaxID=107401 RepID=UPI0012E477BC|nr:hypothetical protein [Tenacibaculum maritimum]CAA0198555.1 hypothetical protein FS0810_200018 [Tenacibaculum maritimum]CAA0258777.1 hypothetical protein TMP248_80119 [Tenacibaculum maritimum]